MVRFFLISSLTLLALPVLAASPIHIVVLGDAAFIGEEPESANSFPMQLETALTVAGYDVDVKEVIAGTSRDAVDKLDILTGLRPDIVIVIAGDARDKLSPEETRKNLDRLLARLREQRVRVVLVGITTPYSPGAEYGGASNRVYADVATANEATLYPSFMEGVAMQRMLLQADGLRPNAAGTHAIVQNMLPYVIPVVEDRIYARSAKSSQKMQRRRRR